MLEEKKQVHDYSFNNFLMYGILVHAKESRPFSAYSRSKHFVIGIISREIATILLKLSYRPVDV